jgi:hypothetical protein
MTPFHSFRDAAHASNTWSEELDVVTSTISGVLRMTNVLAQFSEVK